MDLKQLGDLLVTRWNEACSKIHELNQISPTYGLGSAPHFETARGFATLMYDGSSFHLKLAEKLLTQSTDRIDAIIRHEIGHIVDFAQVPVPPGLPTTPERRADAIAHYIWEQPLLYDVDMVQSLSDGIEPRPSHLGL
jgi:hypothetical protein